MSQQAPISSRKREHIQIVATQDVAAKGITAGFEHIRLPHAALPELDLAEIDTSLTLLGKPMRAPLLISSMTGGAHDVTPINDR